MRTLRCSCISTKSNKLSLTYWYFTRLKMNIAIIAMVCVLPSFYSSLYLWCKTIKVYIKTGIAIRVCYYQCASKTILTYYGTRNVSIGNGIDSKVYSTFGFYIYSTMKMVGTRLSKVARKLYMYCLLYTSDAADE